VNLQEEGRRLKWGVIWDDGTCLSLFLQKKKRKKDHLMNLNLIFFPETIPPTPACRRALSAVISALKKQGHEVVDL